MCYIRKHLAAHVFDVTFNTCYISLRLDFAPAYLINGTHIQPENSMYFEPNMFSHLSTLLISAREKKLTAILGGDINCRYGELNGISQEMNLHYEVNVDMVSNMHGRTYGKDMCQVGDVFPLNHLIHGRNTKSQIDFVYTNKDGLKNVKELYIHSDNWHFSDHKPIEIELLTPISINVSNLLIRTKELNYEFDPHTTRIMRHTGRYDFNMMRRLIEANAPLLENDVLDEIGKCNINGAVKKLHNCLNDIHKKAKIKQKKIDSDASVSMEKANTDYDNYKRCLNGQGVESPDAAFTKYQKSRNDITKEMYMLENARWKSISR